jgi:hypothetical protein
MSATQHTQHEDKTIYIEALEDENDHWLSITDAARVCRVQDVSIRRAITAGRLPVRRQGAGDNKRTRFVRASDLPRANFPILDSTAAITSDIRKVDVLSLPLQQQKLAEEQRQLAVHLDELQSAQEQQRAFVLKIHEETVERLHLLFTMAEEQKALLARMERQWVEYQGQTDQRLNQVKRWQADTDQHMRQQVQHLSDLSSRQEQQMQALSTFKTQIEQQELALQAALDQQAQGLASLKKEIEEQAQTTKVQIDQQSSTLQKQFEQGISTLQEEYGHRIEGLVTEQAKDIAHVMDQVARVQAKAEASITAVDATQHLLDTSEERTRQQLQVENAARQVLEQKLQEEQVARATLEQRLTDVFKLLQEEIATRQALSGEIAHLKAVSPKAKKTQA